MIENEVKFVLTPTLDLSVVPKKKVQRKEIAQGYLSSQARVRKSVENSKTIYRFTYKIALPTGELEEFEMEIDKKAFDRCYSIATNKLEKIRFTWEEDGANWDLDFFKDDTGFYFCMAECEMPSGWLEPKSLPKLISDNLILAVPREKSSDFSSKKISDSNYARRLLTEISPQNLATQ